MRTGLLTFGILLIVVGAVWIGQGANLIGGSFMTGQTTWLWIGLVVAALGCAVTWWAARGYRHFP